MMNNNNISAYYFAQGTSKKTPATLCVEGDFLHIQTDEIHQRIALADLAYTSRLANVPQQIILPDGSMLSVTGNNEWLDRYLMPKRQSWLHFLEMRWRWIALLLTMSIFISYGLFTKGIPTLAEKIAVYVPLEWMHEISQVAYKEMAAAELLNESGLSEEEREHTQSIFSEILHSYPEHEYYFQLKIHSSKLDNAFALPNGLIVVTDGLISKLTDDELTAVLAHEIGHVYHRHAMQAIMQTASSSAVALFLFGDVLGLSIPILLLNLKYSRDAEIEADCFAADYLKQQGKSPELLGMALKKIKLPFPYDDAVEQSEHDLETHHQQELWENIFVLFSTHPNTGDRSNLDKICFNDE